MGGKFGRIKSCFFFSVGVEVCVGGSVSMFREGVEGRMGKFGFGIVSGVSEG